MKLLKQPHLIIDNMKRTIVTQYDTITKIEAMHLFIKEFTDKQSHEIHHQVMTVTEWNNHLIEFYGA